MSIPIGIGNIDKHDNNENYGIMIMSGEKKDTPNPDPGDQVPIHSFQYNETKKKKYI